MVAFGPQTPEAPGMHAGRRGLRPQHPRGHSICVSAGQEDTGGQRERGGARRAAWERPAAAGAEEAVYEEVREVRMGAVPAAASLTLPLFHGLGAHPLKASRCTA